MKRFHQVLALSFLTLLYCSSAAAYTSSSVDQVCPIDGEQFKAELGMSGTVFGRHLDLKPYGAIVAPWPMAKCPSSGFVIYRKDFSADELTRLRSIVATDKYQKLQRRETPYYLAAWLQRALGSSSADTRDTLLQATWEAEDPATYKRYASEALQAYEAALPSHTAGTDEWWTMQLVAGELERRISKFDEAARRFHALTSTPNYESSDYRRIVELQLRLVADRDVESHKIPRAE